MEILFFPFQSELGEKLEDMRIKLAEKKAKEEAESKGESSIAINGYLLCKEGLHHTRATAGLLFSVPNIWLQLWCSECEGARDGHMQVQHTHRHT